MTGPLLYSHMKNNFHHRNTLTLPKLKLLILSKKDNETVRQFAFQVQQLVGKGWCKDTALTIFLEFNEIFTEGFLKKLKDSARMQCKQKTSETNFHCFGTFYSLSYSSKTCSYCHRTNHSILACFKKQRDDEVKQEAYARSKTLQKSTKF